MASEQAAVEVAPHVLDYLRDHATLTLATASPTGVPRATTLTYANDGLTLYVWTRPDTTTARHIQQNPVVSFAIDDYASDWRETKGIQGTGECRVVLDADEIAHAVGLLAEKFQSLSPESPANVSFFRITPTELDFIDSARADGADADQTLEIEYARDVVYSVFRELPAGNVATIASKLQTMEVDAGEVIVRQGAPADKFFIIVDGEAEVLREGDGEAETLNTLGRGDFFGEIAILRDLPRTATVRAVTPVTLLAMERDAFRALVAESLGTTDQFDRVIRDRMNRAIFHR
jgi:nitroimidazol reductase NimA-like FMN-containing flavoprotein (pyridoxamine 5'-phosphate oxidase superfamily)